MVEGFGGGAHFSFHNSPSHLALPTKLNGIHGHQAFVLSASATFCSSKRLRSSSRYIGIRAGGVKSLFSAFLVVVSVAVEVVGRGRDVGICRNFKRT